MALNRNKNLKLYYSIKEVAQMMGVNESMLRYWEKEFDMIKPRKNKKGNRLFTQRDVRYVHIIYQLLKVKGYTLAGEYDIEVYLPPEEGSQDMKVYIWVPLKKT